MSKFNCTDKFCCPDSTPLGCSCQTRSCPPDPRPSCCTGATGATGPAGAPGATGAAGATILGSYETYAAFIAAHPTGTPGDAYLVGGVLYVWDAATAAWKNMGSLVGATGATGATGAAGATILDSYADYAALIAAHPTGTPGDAYLVGGVLYVWDAATAAWKNMGSLIGPTGATGAAGATILDSYEDYAALIAAHPTGTAGDAYLADGVLYVWDAATTAWKAMGSLIGPTGATGATGNDGADGIVGQISGVVDTVAELPATGVEPGTIYYVEETNGVYVYRGAEGWVLADLAQGPRGVTGPTGPTGPTGADGIVGQISGVVATTAELPATGVEPGTIYYVEEDGSVYVYDAAEGWVMLDLAQGPRGATGATGAAGATGSAAASATIIPFASQVAPLTFVNGGVPARVTLIGFGYGDRRGDDLLLVDNYAFAVNSDLSFVLEGDNDNYQLAFSLPFDMSISSIVLTAGNWDQYDPPGTVHPYIQLYAAAPTSNNFLPIAGAVAIPETGHGPGTVPANTLLYALNEGLDIRLRAGTRIAIGALARMDGSTTAQNYYLYFTGGIGMTRWVE